MIGYGQIVLPVAFGISNCLCRVLGSNQLGSGSFQVGPKDHVIPGSDDKVLEKTGILANYQVAVAMLKGAGPTFRTERSLGVNLAYILQPNPAHREAHPTDNKKAIRHPVANGRLRKDENQESPKSNQQLDGEFAHRRSRGGLAMEWVLG
jgi:hypothetical protein